MSRILPPYLNRNYKSTAEKLLFDIFKNGSFCKDWIILHSLNLSQHTKRLYGEIDFLILIPNGGIFVLEVKGGDVKCVDGVWYYTDKYNKTSSSPIGPFNQARDAMFSLLMAIEKHFGKGHKYTHFLFGFFCAFPHVYFDKTSVEYEPWQILDKKVLQTDVNQFFQNLTQSYIRKYKNQKWFSEHTALPNSRDLEILCELLRGDFERIASLKEKIQEFDNNVKVYTSEQYRVLDHIQLNERSIIQGCAGTGKTLIAMESAIRAALAGKNVFLTCYNRLIGEWMNNQLEFYKEKLTSSSLHTFLFNESKGFDYDRTKMGTEEFYSSYLPALLRDIYKKGINTKFDKIIIDEGQDLIRESYLDLFNSMLKGGLGDGNWEIYGDFERQSIYGTLTKNCMFKLVENYSQSAKFVLKVNCRNTRQIGEETSLISGFEKPPFLLEYLEGIPVEYAFYNQVENQCELLYRQLETLKKRDFPLNEVIILSPKKFENSCVRACSNIIIKELKHISDISANQKYFNFATIHSFKGMEASHIIITDIEDLTSEFAKSLLYVGMSRAKYGLTLMISQKLKIDYKNILSNKLL